MERALRSCACGQQPATAAMARPQRGVAALAVTMLLLFAMVLGVAYVNRNLVFEQRASANQYRSTQAFEAAEAGLEWALTQLNRTARIGSDRLPSASAAAASFRQQHLSHDLPTGRYVARTWLDGSIQAPLHPTCVLDAPGWRCSCPGDSAPSLLAPTGSVAAPAFRVELRDVGQAGLVRVVSIGCTALAGPCMPSSPDGVDGTAQVQVLAALLPGLRTLPAAAVTARGSVVASGALGVHNTGAGTGGLGIQAGSDVNVSLAHWSVPAGSSNSGVIARNDSGLAALTPLQFFATYFGLDKSSWSERPTVRRITCASDCTASLEAAMDAPESAQIFIDGDVTIAGPVALGTLQQPVLVVATGAIHISGAVTITGVLYGGSVVWNDTLPPGAAVRGALLSENDFGGNGAPDITRDAAVLQRLASDAGTFARVNGSWRDF
jgi:hypothetical protein